jgi:hypothetical protein
VAALDSLFIWWRKSKRSVTFRRGAGCLVPVARSRTELQEMPVLDKIFPGSDITKYLKNKMTFVFIENVKLVRLLQEKSKYLFS